MFRFLTSGESHGPGLTAILEGIPAGLKLSAEDIDIHLERRQGGYGRGGRMKIEKDKVIFRSGVHTWFTHHARNRKSGLAKLAGQNEYHSRR